MKPEKLDILITGQVRQILRDEEDEVFYGLKIVKGNQIFHAWILRDPEGNGPGFLDIEEVKP